MTSTSSPDAPTIRRDEPREPRLRLARLLDDGSMTRLHDHDDLAVLAVRGRVGGSGVFAFCTDAAKKGGALGLAECLRIAGTVDAAAAHGWPVIGLWHSGGARLTDGVEALHGMALVFAAIVRASGKVPQLSVVLGPAAGGAAYGPALTDLVITAPEARIFITGPDVVRGVTGEVISMQDLGGPDTHARKSGVTHVTAASESDACTRVRHLVGLLTRRGSFAPDPATTSVDPGELLPASTRRAYDVHPVIHALLDRDGEPFQELQAKWAPNVVVGLGRLGGATIGTVANNPLRKGGCLDSLGAEKAARFVRMCDAFGIPLLVLVDVPGFLPGVGQEWGGVVRRGAKLLYAFAEATVPRVTLVMRKSYGGAYIAMNCRALGATAVFAWPQAEVAVMGPEAAVDVLHRKQLTALDAPDRAALRTDLVEQQRRIAGGVGRSLDLGVIDEVIAPPHTRARLIAAFTVTRPPASGTSPPRHAHGNIPL